MRLNVVQAQNFLTLFKCSDVVRMCLFLFKTLFSVVSRRAPRAYLSPAATPSRVFAENIKKWTAEALVGIGLKHDELLQIEG